MSTTKIRGKERKWNALWYALEDGKGSYKKRFTVKKIRHAYQDIEDNIVDHRRKHHLQKLKVLKSDKITFQEITPVRFEHLRKEVDSTNAFFFRKLPNDCYEFEISKEFHNHRYNRILKDEYKDLYPPIAEFVPFYDIVQVFNRQGRLLYFMAQSSGPVCIPNKALSKTPFGNAEYCPDVHIQQNILNYFLFSPYREVVLKLECCDLIPGGIVAVHWGKSRIGRIEPSCYGELVLHNETVPQESDKESCFVKGTECPKSKKYVFSVYNSFNEIIAVIQCRLWKELQVENLQGTRMFGILFKTKVDTVTKFLVLGAAIVWVHEFFRILWNGTASKVTEYKKSTEDEESSKINEANSANQKRAEIEFVYSLPTLPPSSSASDTYEFTSFDNSY